MKIESDSNETNETVDTESGEAENSETKDTVDNETSEAESKGPLQLETLDFTDFSNWRSGIYHWNTGKYMEYSTRICLVDYVTFSGDSYQAQISDTSFKMLIRELDENGNFIKSTTLSNGMNFMPQANTIYLAIGIYRDAEYGLNFEEYRNMFEAGFYAKLVAQ